MKEVLKLMITTLFSLDNHDNKYDMITILIIVLIKITKPRYVRISFFIQGTVTRHRSMSENIFCLFNRFNSAVGIEMIDDVNQTEHRFSSMASVGKFGNTRV